MSDKYYLVKSYYDNHKWTKERVAEAVQCGWITAAEYKRITKEPYPGT